MKKLYAKISYNDYGSYVQPLDSIMDAMDGEFDGVVESASVGKKWTIEIIEMEEDEYNNSPEFTGW